MIDRSEVDQMAKYMSAINLGESGLIEAAGDVPTVRAPAASDTAVAEMKLILERFHAAADQMVTEDAPHDRELREALVTEPTERGARIGAWEIRVNQSGRHKLYDVVNANTGKPLAVDLLLYEAARGLARILNEGGRINSANVIELLRAEQEYGSRVQDMVRYKHHLLKGTNSSRRMVLEDRYSDARAHAAAARERVETLAEGRYGTRR